MALLGSDKMEMEEASSLGDCWPLLSEKIAILLCEVIRPTKWQMQRTVSL
jgi:hypothetical protein